MLRVANKKNRWLNLRRLLRLPRSLVVRACYAPMPSWTSPWRIRFNARSADALLSCQQWSSGGQRRSGAEAATHFTPCSNATCAGHPKSFRCWMRPSRPSSFRSVLRTSGLQKPANSVMPGCVRLFAGRLWTRRSGSARSQWEARTGRNQYTSKKGTSWTQTSKTATRANGVILFSAGPTWSLKSASTKLRSSNPLKGASSMQSVKSRSAGQHRSRKLKHPKQSPPRLTPPWSWTC